MALDSALEVPGAIALVGTFLEEEIAASIGHAEKKLPLGGVQHALLHLTQLDFEHLLELLSFQWAEDHHLIEAVHEFGRKFSSGGFDRGALHLFVETNDWLAARLNNPHATLHELGDFTAAQV